MTAGQDADSRVRRRRLLVLAFVVLLVLVGAGIGSLVGGDSPNAGQTPVVTMTPTETPDGGTGDEPGEPATPTATDTPVGTPDGSPTETATPTDDGSDGDDRDDDDGRDDDRTGGGGSGGSAGSGGSGGGAGSGGGDGSTPTVRLETVGSGAILNYSGVAPGHGGRDEVRLRNAGTREAWLSIADVNVTDRENGITGPEASVDETPDDGELSANVVVVVEAHYPDGTVDSLYDTDEGARSLSALADESATSESRQLGPGEEATVVFDWHVPPETGNVIQSDGAEVDVTFRLRAD